MLGQEKKKCPVCDSTNVKTQKPTFLVKAQEIIWPFKGDSKNLNLCGNCNFSWED